MTGSQMDQVCEAYCCAVYHLDHEQGGLRDRLRGALDELRKCEPCCVAWPAGGYEERVAEDVPRLLEAGDRLDALADAELEDLAGDLRRTQRKVWAAMEARAAEMQDQMLDH